MSRVHHVVTGSVQGVGFRPFIHRLATSFHLHGFVRNTSRGVEIEAQGLENNLQLFTEAIIQEKPSRAQIEQIESKNIPERNDVGFFIAESKEEESPSLALLPDAAICADCLLEYNDPANRRYRYPFIHCTSCGPRFSLFIRMPFDRNTTTMIDFPMCEPCRQEYDNPEDRRFFSQTTCCPNCGPKLILCDKNQNHIATQYSALEETSRLLEKGAIVAFKNTGGYLLLADATNEETVQLLRKRKKRPKKPFAVLVDSIESARKLAELSPAEEALLTSPGAPIVLVKKQISSAVSSSCPSIGIMLPHTAALYSISSFMKRPLIATSGNLSGHPLAITEEEAFDHLKEIADYFVIHNRRINHRLDDSVAQVINERPMMVRRARGFIPYAISIVDQDCCVIGAGSQTKNTFSISLRGKIYISQHIGDLDSVENMQVYEQEVQAFKNLLSAPKHTLVTDPHPQFFSSSFPGTKNYIYHHHAHAFAGIADNNVTLPVLAISWDGTGFGDDGTVWGGESFVISEKGIHRCSSLYPFQLIGGEAAVKEPRRIALALLHPSFYQLFGWTKTEYISICKALEKKINSPACSSIGRLFDGVSALLTDTFQNSHEGEAALALEALARQCEQTSIQYTMSLLDDGLMDWRPLVSSIVQDIVAKKPKSQIALAFHQTLAYTILEIAKRQSIHQVLLTGGVMQNSLLLTLSIDLLKKAGFSPLWHKEIPPNDGGISIGQIVGVLRKGF